LKTSRLESKSEGVIFFFLFRKVVMLLTILYFFWEDARGVEEEIYSTA